MRNIDSWPLTDSEALGLPLRVLLSKEKIRLTSISQREENPRPVGLAQDPAQKAAPNLAEVRPFPRSVPEKLKSQTPQFVGGEVGSRRKPDQAMTNWQGLELMLESKTPRERGAESDSVSKRVGPA
jgi:hypothetical protein